MQVALSSGALPSSAHAAYGDTCSAMPSHPSPTLAESPVTSNMASIYTPLHPASLPDYSPANCFMGWGTASAGVTVAPSLRKGVANALKADAEVQKEARKAREERKLNKKKAKARLMLSMPTGTGRCPKA